MPKINTQSAISRRQLLASASAFGSLVLVSACSDSKSDNANSPENSSAPAKSGSTKGIGAPGVAAAFDPEVPYLIFGVPGASKVVEIFVDYRCPHCKNFFEANHEYVQKLAENSTEHEVELRLYPRPMLDARTGTTFSSDTATAVVASYIEDPASVWQMEAAMFELMPTGPEQPHPSTQEVAAAAKAAGASDKVVAAVENSEYINWLLSVESVGQERQIGTPTIYIDSVQYEGDIYSKGSLEAALNATK